MKSENYNQKRNMITQEANTLFLKKGYDCTTIDDILKSLKIAKGTFYHYFSGKGELLEAIVDKHTNSFITELLPIVDSKTMSAIEKLNAYYKLNQVMKRDNKALILQVISVWYREENLLYKERLNKSLLNHLTPQVEKILIQGATVGAFDIIDPKETSIIIINLGFSLRDRIIEELITKKTDPERIDDIVDAYERSIEKMLVITKGSLEIFSRDYFLHE